LTFNAFTSILQRSIPGGSFHANFIHSNISYVSVALADVIAEVVWYSLFYFHLGLGFAFCAISQMIVIDLIYGFCDVL